jgi:hypothetical protein
MKKIGYLSILILSIWATAMAGNSLRLIEAKGEVNTADIGGNGLRVISLWDKSKGAPVSADGNFVAVISDSNPQKLWVKDDKMNTRALAIVIPENSDNVFFDAKSTALALLFQDADSFRNSAEVENISLMAMHKKSFQDLVSFLKHNLPARDLEELMNNEECVKLLENCSKEILGQDQVAIRESLYEAKDKLEKLL